MKVRITCVIMHIAAAICALVGCDVPTPEKLEGAVNLPDSYSIVYKVLDADGVIHTVAKSVDNGGNVYFRSGDKELLFIKDGNTYKEYERSLADESFKEGNEVNRKFVDAATEEIDEYTEQSKKKYMPGVKENGSGTMAGRECAVYTVKVGTSGHNLSYNYYVDKETGVCLGFESEMVLGGVNLDNEDGMFTCVEFKTELAEDLSGMLAK